MRELRGLLLDLRRGASAFSRKAVLLVVAISAVIVLIALEKGDRKASTIKISDVVAEQQLKALSPPAVLSTTPTVPLTIATQPIKDEAVATDENAWNLLRRFFRDQAEAKRVDLVKKRNELYDQQAAATQKAMYGGTFTAGGDEDGAVEPNAAQEALRYRAALEVNAAQMAALIDERDRYLDDVHEQVRHAFAAAKRKRRTITGYETIDGFLKEFFDRGSALHAVYDTVWYAALAIAVVSISAFIFIAIIQLLSLPSKLTEAFNAHVGELLEKAPELMKQLGTAEALKTGAASVIALTVGFSAVRGTADHAKSSPANDNAPIEAGVLSPSDFAWSSSREFSGKTGSLGRDGQAGRDGRDGSNGRDPANGRDGRDSADGRDGRDGVVGRDGRDGFNGRDGRDGQRGPQGPGGAAPIDVWSSSINGLKARTEAAEEGLRSLNTALASESGKRAAAEQKTVQLLAAVDDLKKNNDQLTSAAAELKKHKGAVITQGGLWDVRPWWEDAHLTSRYQVGPLSLAILKAKLGVKDNVDINTLSQPEKDSRTLYDHLASLSESKRQLTAKEFEERITTDITGPVDWKLIALIMDICRLPR